MTLYEKALAYLEYDATHYSDLGKINTPYVVSYIAELRKLSPAKLIQEYNNTKEENEKMGRLIPI